MNINIGQISEGLNRGTWGDWTTEHIVVDVIKHHCIVTLNKGTFTEQLKVHVLDCTGDGWSVTNNTLTKTADPIQTIVLTLVT